MKALPFGAFNGERRKGLEVNGFALAEFVDRPEDTITLHTHADVHFWFLLDGLYITSATGVEALCAPPTVIFNPAGTTHRDRFHTRGGRFLTLSIAPDHVGRLSGHRALTEQALGSASGELPWLGRRLYRELCRPDELSPMVIEGLALELLAATLRERARSPRDAAPWLQAALELIHESYMDKLTVQGIAATLNVRPLLLGRSFRRAFGCTPGEMLRRRRVERAEELLRKGSLPLAEIALASGFADQAQLTKAFRRVTGSTPGEYRRLLFA